MHPTVEVERPSASKSSGKEISDSSTSDIPDDGVSKTTSTLQKQPVRQKSLEQFVSVTKPLGAARKRP